MRHAVPAAKAERSKVGEEILKHRGLAWQGGEQGDRAMPRHPKDCVREDVDQPVNVFHAHIFVSKVEFPHLP